MPFKTSLLKVQAFVKHNFHAKLCHTVFSQFPKMFSTGGGEPEHVTEGNYVYVSTKTKPIWYTSLIPDVSLDLFLSFHLHVPRTVMHPVASDLITSVTGHTMTYSNGK